MNIFKSKLVILKSCENKLHSLSSFLEVAMTNAIILGIIITAIIAVGLVMHYMGNVLSEFSDHFFHLTIFLLIFLIGAAVYMSYALPSVAITRPETNDDIKVYRDNPPHKTLMETFFEE